MIYHIATFEDWEAHVSNATYEPAGYALEGFIHCSMKEQVPGVLQRYYAGVKNLILLHIDESKLMPELKYEASTNDELYPHLYGPLNKNAIVLIENL